MRYLRGNRGLDIGRLPAIECEGCHRHRCPFTSRER
jgi:hypothetical protein